MSTDFPKVDARTFIEVNCHCPHCEAFLDVFENVREVLGSDLRAENVDVEVTCPECLKLFIVENVEF